MSETHLTVRVEGVVVPRWLAVILLACVLCGALAVLLAGLSYQQAEREYRILQLHVADLENVLIRNGIAERSDFASWHEGSAPAYRVLAAERERSTIDPEE